MLLCAEDAEGNLSLMTPEKKCRQEQRYAKALSRALERNDFSCACTKRNRFFLV